MAAWAPEMNVVSHDVSLLFATTFTTAGAFSHI